ncbi:MAG: amino acid ABC transporter permease [Acidobacteriota bacterium]
MTSGAAADGAAAAIRPASVPKDAGGMAALALVAGGSVAAAAFWTSTAVRAAIVSAGIARGGITVVLGVLSLASLGLLVPAFRSLASARRGRAARMAGDLVTARVEGAASRTWCWFTLGYGAAVSVVLAFALFLVVNDMAVGRTFFFFPVIRESFDLVRRAFLKNVFIFCVAEVLVLVWGLVIAVARLAPGAPGRPIRLLATAYTDVFRGLPAIITIHLVGFGLPLTGLPIFTRFDVPLEWYAILALTLTYGAYVAEVYRSGIESIHWSQTAAARSLGLSFGQTLRFVVVPQAVRRIIPPLLNDFIGLQKDTALVNVIGAIDAFNQAKIVASNHFNLSAVTTVAILFVLITIPQARAVDRLLERDQKRMRAGG